MDAEDAVEAVAFAALDVPAVTALADVHQHVPDKAPAPMLIIGDMTSQDMGVKGGGAARVDLTIAAIVEGEERKAIRVLKKAVLAQLNGLNIVHQGWQLAFTFIDSDGFRDPEEGKAYMGNFRFEVLAFATA